MLTKLKEKSKSAWAKIKEKSSNIKPIHSYRHSSTIHRIAKVIVVAVILLAAIVEIILGVMIYGFKSETKFVKLASRYLPMPVVFSSHGVVTAGAYFEEKNYINHFYASTGQKDVNDTDLSKQILTQLTENNIIKDEAIKYKLTISDKEIEEAYAKIVEQNSGNESVEKVLNDLYGLTVKQFKNLIRVQLLRDKFNTDIIVRVTVRHILVRVDENATEEQVAAAKEKIEGYKKEIEGGLDFAEAAKKYSEDVGSNENGGLLDPFARGDMVKPFEEAAFSLPVGTISDPVRTSFGWHIMRVEGRTGLIDESFDNWLSDLKSKSITINLLKI